MPDVTDDLGPRLADFVAYKGLSLNRFSNMVGFAQGGLSRVVRKNQSFSVAKLALIFQRFPELNHRWLLFGEGEMLVGGTTAHKALRHHPPTEDEIYTILAENEQLRLHVVKLEAKLEGMAETVDSLGRKLKIEEKRGRGRPRKS